jgi:hypothetical protein
MIIDYLLVRKTDFLFDIFLILLTIIITYWYTEEMNFIYYLKALINEIKGNISQLTEVEFNNTLEEMLNRQRNWLAKGVSLRVASGISQEGFLYQYLLDHAYTIFVSKGYILKLQNWRYVKGGPFDQLGEFYLDCGHFNYQSFPFEQAIHDSISQNRPLNDYNDAIVELRGLRSVYSERINTNAYQDLINYLDNFIGDFYGKSLVLFLVILTLLIVFA